jgi:hypothetical protein
VNAEYPMSTSRICHECGYSADDDEDRTIYDGVGLCESCFAKTAQTPAKTSLKTNRRTRWIISAAGAAVALGFGVVVALAKRGDREGGWSKEGADWLDNLPWEDALYLLTRQEDDIRTGEDDQRIGKLRTSYQAATGYEWE